MSCHLLLLSLHRSDFTSVIHSQGAEMDMESNWLLETTGIFFMITLNVVALAGNSALLAVLTTTPALRRFVFVLHLCVIDLLAATLLMPMGVASSAPALGCTDISHAACRAYVFLNVCLISACILTVSAISVERYYYIVHPMRYEGRIEGRLAAAVLAFIWVKSGLTSVVPQLNWRESPGLVRKVPERNGTELLCSLYWSGGDYKKIFVVIFSLLCFVVPGAIVIAVYCSVFKVARIAALQQGPLPSWTASTRHRSESFVSQMTAVNMAGRARSSSFNSQARSSQPAPHISPDHAFSGGKAAVTLLILVGQFMACWLPYFAFHLHAALQPRSEASAVAEALVTWLAYSAFAVNPIFYGWLNRQIREELLKCVACCTKRQTESLPAISSQGSIEESFFQFLQRTGAPADCSPALITKVPLDPRDAITCRIPGQVPEEVSDLQEIPCSALH
uniref:G protein-coupled receptor 61-like n=1 Tax=Eptatretus burgeri TaxID=7764 RepID=A0A8C4QWY0_EPTBU